MSVTHELTFEPIDNARLANLVGPMDENLHQVEQRLSVRVYRRGGQLVVSGEEASVAQAEKVIERLFELSLDEALTPDRVHLCLQESGMEEAPTEAPPSEVIVHTQRGGVRGRGPNQKQYLAQIRANDCTFGIGPAGIGKTYLAVACAVDAL